MKEFLYNIIYGIFYLVSKLPYRALYVRSDIANLVLYHIVRYRRDIVRRNITSAFPEKSLEECISIERGFYKWFCDYFVETVKLMSVSRQELLSRIEFRGIDKIEECFDRGQTCAGILGHYGNWELLSATGLVIKKHPEAVIGLIYHPLRSQLFDRLFINLRTKFGSFGIKKQDTVRDVITLKKNKTRCVVIFIADQTPSRNNLHYWTNFLNQDSSILTGPERLARKLDLPVIFLDTKQVKRGYYTVDMKLVTPKETPENWITEQYARLMEKCILRNPSGWLWTHKRWKHKRVESGELKVES